MPAGSIIGGLISQGGANAAGATYGQAAKNADYIRHANEAKLSPWFSSGVGAQDLISQLLGLGHYTSDGQGYGGLDLDKSNWQGDQKNALSRFQVSPDYQFRLQEGQRALDRSAASKGMLLSGAQSKASQEYGGNLASGEYNNWFSKLAGVGSQGLTAGQGDVSSNLNALAQQNAALAGQASSYQNAANALASGIGKGIQNGVSLFSGMGGLGGLGSMFGGGGGGMAAAGTPGSPYYGPTYSGV